MNKRLWCLISMAMVVCLAFHVVAVGAAPTSSSESKSAGASYGPCCPYVTGHNVPAAANPASYWDERGRYRGPERVCLTPKPVSVVFEGKAHRVDAVEVNGNLLIPQRVLAITGATVDYAGGGKTVAALGSRKLELTLGHHEVNIAVGDNSVQTTWSLCPRLRHDISYVPLRPAAQALGLAVYWDGQQIVLTSGGPVPTGLSTAKCPADQMEEDLGVTLLRGPLSGPFGPGIGILAVTDGGRGAQLGLQPRDVILTANGKRVQCPKDLEAALTASEGTTTLNSLGIARGRQQMTLGATK